MIVGRDSRGWGGSAIHIGSEDRDTLSVPTLRCTIRVTIRVGAAHRMPGRLSEAGTCLWQGPAAASFLPGSVSVQ